MTAAQRLRRENSRLAQQVQQLAAGGGGGGTPGGGDSVYGGQGLGNGHGGQLAMRPPDSPFSTTSSMADPSSMLPRWSDVQTPGQEDTMTADTGRPPPWEMPSEGGGRQSGQGGGEQSGGSSGGFPGFSTAGFGDAASLGNGGSGKQGGGSGASASRGAPPPGPAPHRAPLQPPPQPPPNQPPYQPPQAEYKSANVPPPPSDLDKFPGLAALEAQFRATLGAMQGSSAPPPPPLPLPPPPAAVPAAAPQLRPQLQPQATPPQSASGSSKPDPKAVAWARANPWFGPDAEMTEFAYRVHDELVGEQARAFLHTLPPPVVALPLEMHHFRLQDSAEGALHPAAPPAAAARCGGRCVSDCSWAQKQRQPNPFAS